MSGVNDITGVGQASAVVHVVADALRRQLMNTGRALVAAGEADETLAILASKALEARVDLEQIAKLAITLWQTTTPAPDEKPIAPPVPTATTPAIPRRARRTRGGRKAVHRTTPAEKAKVVALAAGGKSAFAISKATGLGYGAVRLVLGKSRRATKPAPAKKVA